MKKLYSTLFAVAMCAVAVAQEAAESVAEPYVYEFTDVKVNAQTAYDKDVNRPRIIVTTDGEEDDRASMVRFLLSSNEFDIEAIVNSSSQFHWVGGKGWNAFHDVSWVKEYIGYYATVYNNLRKHDNRYPSPEFLLSKWRVGNIDGNGEFAKRSEGAELIADVLLDETDPRPIWIQAWGGCNTIARALQIIEQEHPHKMAEVAEKIRLYLIWEQDDTYQRYIKPKWGRYNIVTIISDQFDCMAYIWNKVLPSDAQERLKSEWMSKNILSGHGALCSAYPNKRGMFNAEGDSPAFLHTIPTGLRNMESPDYGGWGGRYVLIGNNVWSDPYPSDDMQRPTGQLSIHNSWSKRLENRKDSVGVALRTAYFKPIWRWMNDMQNDFAARADWCVASYDEANHHPIVRLHRSVEDMTAQAGDIIKLNAKPSSDPDADKISIRWWNYAEADSYNGAWNIDALGEKIKFHIPRDAKKGDTIHIICEVSDDGQPMLKAYKRIIITIV